MKTANRGGHNYQSAGASGYVNEVTEDRLINAAVIKHLKTLGHNPNDVTPGNRDVNADLIYGVQMANNLDVDIFNSNHLNAHITCKEAKGCECVTYGDAASVLIANRIRDNIVKLGFKHRENKVNKTLYEVKATVMPSVIVEPFFVDSYADVQLYYKIGADEIGRAIAYGLIRKEFNIKNEENKNGDVVDVLIFNEEFYLKEYSDVKAAVNKGQFKNGLDHYNRSGKNEKHRLPVPPIPLNYNEGIYRLANKSVDEAIKNKSFLNGMDHYIRYGWKENRIYCMPNDWVDNKYLELNKDVAKEVALNKITAKEHYILYGRKENRKYK